jgi:hypothetical protein
MYTLTLQCVELLTKYIKVAGLEFGLLFRQPISIGVRQGLGGGWSKSIFSTLPQQRNEASHTTICANNYQNLAFIWQN